jgi:hypothetical protein
MITILLLVMLLVLFGVLVSFTGIQWIYLCRISILSGLFLGALPILALTSARSLVLGAYDISGGWQSAAFGFCFFLALWAISTVANIVLEAGSFRVDHEIVRNVKVVKVVGGVSLALITILNWNTIWRAGEEHGLAASLWFWAGMIVGLLIFLMERFLTKPKAGAGPRVAHGQATVRLLGKQHPLPQWLTRGYLAPGHGAPALSQVHVKALIAVVIMLLIYAGIYFISMSFQLPAAAYIALVVTVLALLLGGAAFFLDAYRIPVILPLLIWIWLFSGNPKADHYFELQPSSEQEPLPTDPGSVLADAEKDGCPIVLVAAAGGGIQAAAWTAQVLSGLERELDSVQPELFVRSVRLLSGVSGGSTGVMYYVNSAYPLANPQTEQDRLDAALLAAESSSLESAVRGLAYTDLHRALAPFCIWNRFHDRAEELEEAWVRNGDVNLASLGVPSLAQATLKGWRHDLANRQRPAVIFNSTVVETGERFSFSTSRLINPQQIAQGQADFDQEHPSTDIKISTAARLSATFPFVSPVARSLTQLPEAGAPTNTAQLHFADGGYFDNSGLVALSTWLDFALQALEANHKPTPAEIVVIQIYPFPSLESSTKSENPPPLFQVLSPLQTVLTVRNEVQAGFSQRDFEFMTKRWELEREHSVKIHFFQVAFPAVKLAENPPLSWHLRQSDIAQINEAWNTIRTTSQVTAIVKYFQDAVDQSKKADLQSK